MTENLTPSSEYDAAQITVLPGLEAVRLRPGMYIGSTGPRGLHHLIWEVVDNSVDEAMAEYADRITVEILPDGGCSVTDNGRGIPVDIHTDTQESALTTVLTTLHAGGKFEEGAYTVSGGLHGVGVSVVNALSVRLKAEIVRDGYVWSQSFRRGEPEDKVKRGRPARKAGTTITFWPDPTVFTDTVTFDYKTVSKRLRELAFLNRGLTIDLTDNRGKEPRVESFCYEGGVNDFVAYLNDKRETLHDTIISLTDTSETAELEVALQWTDSFREHVASFANNINTHEGGTHEEGFRLALTKAVNDFGRSTNQIKTKEANLSGDDVREGLTAVISVKVREPQFEGQTKTKLGNTEIRSYVQKTLNRILPEWLQTHPREARRVVDKACRARHAREAARKARDVIRRKSLLDSSRLPGKLVDCTSNDPSVSELFIVEGDSAAGPAKNGRDSRFQAVLPIRGKILNVEKAGLSKALHNKEIQSLITAIGGGVGKSFDVSKARYHKVVLLTDADVDGAHIRTLLLTFFYRQMTALVDAGYVYISVPPLYRVKIGKKAHYLADDDALEQFRLKHPKARPTRFKGLGEMNDQELGDTALNVETRTMLQVQPDPDPESTDILFSTLMGTDVPSRREYIRTNAGDVRFLDI